jgi:hypothetical protein
MVVVAPWVTFQTIRLGKFAPIKSNTAYELYQSQVVLPDGLMSEKAFSLHPYHANSAESKRYRELGETAYLEEKKIQARQAIVDDPWGYISKTSRRFLAVTVWMDSELIIDREAILFKVAQVFATFPFLGLLALIYRLPNNKDWVLPTIGCYVAYLLPYVLISYYERYGVPLTLPRILLTMWLLIVVKERFSKKGNRLIANTQ